MLLSIRRFVVWAIATMQLSAAAYDDDPQVALNSKHGASYVRERLIDAQVIPTVIDDFKPLIGIDASWNSHSAKLGNTLDPEDLQSSPSIHFKHLKADSTLNLDAGVTHVLALTDPDAPSRDNPKWSEFCHWLATSNPSDSSDLQLKDIVEYKPPGPPPKTGKHRYVFLVLVPANGTTEKLHLAKPSDRKHWGSDKEEHGVRQWADEHDLVPVAANFIYAQNAEQ